MSIIKNVAVIGGGGNIGAPIVNALLDANFNVTILARPTSTSKFPPLARVHTTDYSSPESLAAAFNGQDAVVSAIAAVGIAQQQNIIDAAVKAGVKRYIPSEFGVNTLSIGDSGIGKILGGKVKILDYLKGVSAENPHFTWTGLSTGSFLDWGLKAGILSFIIKNKSATIFDSGDEPFRATTLKTVGFAVASILNHPQETANRYLDIFSFNITQNTLLGILEEETGTKWTVIKAKTDDFIKSGDEKLAKGDFSAFVDYLKAYNYRDGEGHAISLAESANAELGLPEEDLRQTVKTILEGQ